MVRRMGETDGTMMTPPGPCFLVILFAETDIGTADVQGNVLY